MEEQTSKIDLIVQRCVARALSRENVLLALAESLEVLALDPTWTFEELTEIKKRAISGIVDAHDGDAESDERPAPG